MKTIHICYCGSRFRLSSLNYADMATADISSRVNHATMYLAPTCLIRETLPDPHTYPYSATRIFITSDIICDQWSHIISTDDDRRKYPSIRIVIFRNSNAYWRIFSFRIEYYADSTTVEIAVFLESTILTFTLRINNNRHLKDRGVKFHILIFNIFVSSHLQ